MGRTNRAWVGLFSAWILVGCGEKEKPSTVPDKVPDSVTQMIGMAGGVVTTPGGASITVPAGAVTVATMFTIDEVTSAVPAADGQAVGPVYRFGPSGMTFSVPVTMTLPFNAAAIPAGGDKFRDLKVLTAPDGTTDYTSLGRAQVIDDGHASAQTTHFSLCVIVYQAPDGNLCQVNCTPGENAQACTCAGTCSQYAIAVSCAAGSCACTKDGDPVNTFSASCENANEAAFRAGLGECVALDPPCGANGEPCCETATPCDGNLSCTTGGICGPAASCGNGVLDTGEVCENGTSTPCPQSCPTNTGCDRYTLSGSAASCDATCINTPVSACQGADGCCPGGCTNATDSDCPASDLCGNGVLDDGETCDDSAGKLSACEPACVPDTGCNRYTYSGSVATCDALCANTPVVVCQAADSCCPAGCTNATDGDCALTGRTLGETCTALDPCEAGLTCHHALGGLGYCSKVCLGSPECNPQMFCAVAPGSTDAYCQLRCPGLNMPTTCTGPQFSCSALTPLEGGSDFGCTFP